ncbi:MAG: DUF21 domain-containing protein [Chloroflexi bacterium]|nr:DUF21 domain-containing protein [Anaerolineae bacterium]MCC6567084.1 DUF21 domain-containing protein [Chloroflexota bacterium]
MNPLIELSAVVTAAQVAPTDSAPAGTVGGMLFYIALGLSLSFLCSLLEAVLLTTSTSSVEVAVAEGKRAGVLMRKHKQDLELTISAILTLNTVAHTVGAAGAGAEAVALFGSEYFGLISAVLTLLILVASEILPKTIGANYAKQLMPFTAYTLRGMVIVMYPALVVMQWIARLVGGQSAQPTVSRAELAVLADVSHTEGGLAESENRVLKNLLKLSELSAYDVMTPRTVMFALPAKMTVAEASARHKVLPFSRIPIYGRDYDDIEGYVLRSDILGRVAEDADSVQLHALCRPINSVPETLRVDRALEKFIADGDHLFLVFDEYGGTAGLITLEDALETLLGAEIMDETDISRDMRVLAQERSLAKLRAMGIEPDSLNPNTEEPDDTESATTG